MASFSIYLPPVFIVTEISKTSVEVSSRCNEAIAQKMGSPANNQLGAINSVLFDKSATEKREFKVFGYYKLSKNDLKASCFLGDRSKDDCKNCYTLFLDFQCSLELLYEGNDKI